MCLQSVDIITGMARKHVFPVTAKMQGLCKHALSTEVVATHLISHAIDFFMAPFDAADIQVN